MLYLIATPIGNLGDITLRSIEVLKDVDAIICEDTRRSALLLNHLQIKKPLIVLNDHNESLQIDKIVSQLSLGANLALVSDAGTPLISDPGFKLVRACKQADIPVDSLPGPTSILPALSLSTLPPDKFTFLGYLPDKPGHRQSLFHQVQDSAKILPTTFIIFLPPFKIIRSLTEMQQVFGDIPICLAKELTKIHQSIKLQPISIWLNEFKSRPPKGEWVGLFRL